MPSLFRAKPPAFWAALLLASPAAWAAGPDAPDVSAAAEPLPINNAAVLAATCVNCHGVEGRASGPVPALNGQPAERLLQRMRDFKSGEAADATVMTRLMKGYDDVQIEELARWFAAEEGK